MLLKELRS